MQRRRFELIASGCKKMKQKDPNKNLIGLAEERFSYFNRSLDFISCVIEFPLKLKLKLNDAD